MRIKMRFSINWLKLFKEKDHDDNKNNIVSLSPDNKLYEKNSSSDFSKYELFLKSAFKNDQIRNIAITGNYGVGKSSIIRSFEAKDKNKGKGYLYISLMDFNDNRGFNQTKLKQKEPEDTECRKQLQQEFERYLLCQILSRVDAQYLPHSTFRLIPSNKKHARILFALLFAAFTFCIFGIFCGSTAGVSPSFLKMLYYILWIICTFLVFALILVLSRSFTMTKFTAGFDCTKVEAEMETIKTTGSYIDDHIFEIIYALETMANDIGYTVVLEDMDRLGRNICIDVFSKLRRINYLVNDRKKLKKRYIRFIYAFDDSVFELTKNAKFFDYVMSITPNLNYNTSGKFFKDLILQSLSDSEKKQSTLKKIILQYDNEFWEHTGMVIHDYRMINHIRNDFQLFANIMLNRDFEPDIKWLPFVIYKNILAEDYCRSFDEKCILELDKEARNLRIENFCFKKGEIYSQSVKFLFEYIIDKIKLNGKDFQKFTGLPQKFVDIRNETDENDILKELFNIKIETNQKNLTKYLNNKKILITGGGGTIGSEICRQIANYDVDSIIIVDVSEDKSFEIEQELIMKYTPNKFKLYTEVASICDAERIDSIFEKYKPDIVIHTAANKNVYLMENNIDVAIKNNILGTYNVILASEKHKVGKFTFLSTYNADNPTTIVAATKRFCELMINSRPNRNTIFCIVRFGNTLSKNASIVSLIKKKIESGGPIIENFAYARDFISTQEACNLVLQSGAMANISKNFILYPGTSVKIISLVEYLIRSYGLIPYEDIKIIPHYFRPGEKLYETILLTENNDFTKTEIDKIFLIPNDNIIETKKIEDAVSCLSKFIEDNKKTSDLIKIIKEIVTTY